MKNLSLKFMSDSNVFSRFLNVSLTSRILNLGPESRFFFGEFFLVYFFGIIFIFWYFILNFDFCFFSVFDRVASTKINGWLRCLCPFKITSRKSLPLLLWLTVAHSAYFLSSKLHIGHILNNGEAQQRLVHSRKRIECLCVG